MEESRKKYIETSTGVKFYPYEPAAEQININDIAHALSQLCRFGGHCKFFYSVAQHSLLISEQLEKEGYGAKMQLYGLLHDATEAYMVDIPTPIKSRLTEYKEAENKLHDIIWEAFGIATPTVGEWLIIKEWDIAFQYHEANTLLPIAAWSDPNVKLEVELKEEKISVLRADFLKRFESLIAQVQ